MKTLKIILIATSLIVLTMTKSYCGCSSCKVEETNKKTTKTKKTTAPLPGSKNFNVQNLKKDIGKLFIYTLGKNEQSFINELIGDTRIWISKYNKNNSTPQEDKEIEGVSFINPSKSPIYILYKDGKYKILVNGNIADIQESVNEKEIIIKLSHVEKGKIERRFRYENVKI